VAWRLLLKLTVRRNRRSQSGYFAGKTNRNEIIMTNSNDIQLDRVHTAAIRREIGDRLRISLNAERAPMTPTLLDLLDRLAVQDRCKARATRH
jgi:hypothetical protein